MMNYRSATNALREKGYSITNTCEFDGNFYHDFNSRKRDASVSLIVEITTGTVKWAEVSTRKWENGRYIPVVKKITGLQELINEIK